MTIFSDNSTPFELTELSASVGVPQTNPADQSTATKSQWNDQFAEQMARARIAIVDDEELNIEVVQGYLEQEGYKNFFRTSDARKAMDMIAQTNPDVVLLDVMMPHVSGLEILASMKEDADTCHIPVIILTACSGSETKLQALRLGSSDFLAKPVDASELLLRLRNVLSAKAYQDHLANYSDQLEMEVKKRTEEVVESRQRIIHCLARAAEFRDDDTGHHVIRVGKYAAVIAAALGFSEKHVNLLEQAAQLHDIGKIGVSDSILLKEGKLDPEEYEVIKRHCSFGNSIINPMSAREVDSYRKHTEVGSQLLEMDGYPVMELAGMIAQTHHEKFDGSGYPLGLAGEDIPIEGRITAVADVFDALDKYEASLQAGVSAG